MNRILLILIASSLLLIPQISDADLTDPECDTATQSCMRVHVDGDLPDGNNNTWAGLHAREYLQNNPNPDRYSFKDTAFGWGAMRYISGLTDPGETRNTAFGTKALRGLPPGQNGGVYPSGGYFNTAVGNSTLYNITDGTFNTAVGLSAMATNTTGSYNVGMGLETLHGDNHTGNYNTTLGTYSLHSNSVKRQAFFPSNDNCFSRNDSCEKSACLL